MGTAAPYVFIALLAGSQVYAGYEKKQAGKAAQYELEAKARQEKLSARDSEIRRRQALLKSLANRSATLAAQGTTFEGSPSALLINDFRNFELDNTTAAAQNAATQNSLKIAGQNYARQGRIGFVGGIFNAAATVAGGFGGGGTKDPTAVANYSNTSRINTAGLA